jgi:hypothetical protein
MRDSLRLFPLVLIGSIFFCLPETRPVHASPLANLAAPSPGASEDDSLEMVTNDGQGKEKRLRSSRGVIEQVGLNSSQSVAITLHFPASRSGTPVILGALDGGQIILPPGSDSIRGDGTVRFRFQAGTTPGLYRLLVQLPGQQHRLQFYVIDPQHPRRPTTARSGN